jgi:hypothetical protein
MEGNTRRNQLTKVLSELQKVRKPAAVQAEAGITSRRRRHFTVALTGDANDMITARARGNFSILTPGTGRHFHKAHPSLARAFRRNEEHWIACKNNRLGVSPFTAPHL